MAFCVWVDLYVSLLAGDGAGCVYHYIGGESMARGKPTPGDKRELVKSLKYLNPELSTRDIAKEAKSHTVHILKDLDNDDVYSIGQRKKRSKLSRLWTLLLLILTI